MSIHSTIEQQPTTERQLFIKNSIDKICQEFVSKYGKYVELVNTHIYRGCKKFEFPHVTSLIGDSLMALVAINDTEKYSAVISTTYEKLSKNYRLGLKRLSDGYRKFKPVLFPTEKIKGATLHMGLAFPKDEEKLYQFLNGTIDPRDQWMYDRDQVQTFWTPVAYVDAASDGSIQFYDGIFCISLYHPASIEIHYETRGRIACDTIPTIGVEHVFLQCEERNLLPKIYNHAFDGDKLTIEVERKISTKGCPLCCAEIVMVCECEMRDSYCANGHHWHYSETGEIILGQAQH